MSDKYASFTEYLRSIHAEDCTGLDDDMTDSFGEWLETLDADDFSLYGNRLVEIINK